MAYHSLAYPKRDLFLAASYRQLPAGTTPPKIGADLVLLCLSFHILLLNGLEKMATLICEQLYNFTELKRLID